ncbi:hypothetical protein FALCPG4_002743 [Fusarium falciforme]
MPASVVPDQTNNESAISRAAYTRAFLSFRVPISPPSNQTLIDPSTDTTTKTPSSSSFNLSTFRLESSVHHHRTQPAPLGLPLSHTRDLPRLREPQKSRSLADTDTTTAIYRYHCRYNSIATGPGLGTQHLHLHAPCLSCRRVPVSTWTPSPFSGSGGKQSDRPQQTRPDRDHLTSRYGTG